MEMSNRNAKEEFDSQGFLVFDPQVPMQTIDRAASALRGLFVPDGEPEDRSGEVVAFRDNRRIQDAWRVIPEVKAIATAPRVLELLHSLYARKPMPFQTLNFRVGSEQKTHSDTVHFNSRPAGFMCGVWTALEDIDLENGPVMYYPGSQKWPEVALADVDEFGREGFVERRLARIKTRLRVLRSTEADYQVYEKVIQERIDAARIDPVYATIRKGQAFIWAANLLHGGSQQRDRNRTRMSQVTHYFFEGCRYYTPLLQRGLKTAWRTPEWIT